MLGEYHGTIGHTVLLLREIWLTKPNKVSAKSYNFVGGGGGEQTSAYMESHDSSKVKDVSQI